MTHFAVGSSIIMGILLYAIMWNNFRSIELLGLRSLLDVRIAFYEASLMFSVIYFTFLVILFITIRWVATKFGMEITNSLTNLNKQLLHIHDEEYECHVRLKRLDFFKPYCNILNKLHKELKRRSEEEEKTNSKLNQLFNRLGNKDVKAHFESLMANTNSLTALKAKSRKE